MEISFQPDKNKTSRSKKAASASRKVTEPGASFDKMLNRQLSGTASAAQFIEEIDRLAQHLAFSRQMEDLQRYKLQVKKFLQWAVEEGWQVKRLQVRERNGRVKQHVLVRQIDQALIELTEAVMAQETPRLAIIARMDQIRGFLINLSI